VRIIIFFLLLTFSAACDAQSVSEFSFNLYFKLNNYQISKDQEHVLDSVLKIENLTIRSINGFADTTGNDQYNLELSTNRSKAVYNYLYKMKLADSSVSIKSFGEKFSGQQDPEFDRRVEIRYEILMQDKPLERDSVSIPAKYEISDIYFVPDLPIIESFSIPVVDDIAKYLKTLGECKFKVVGHVNYVLSDAVKNNPKAMEPVIKLSEDRAKTVYEMLIERGIPEANLSYIGMGNSQMIYKKPRTDEEKRRNMRVEILIYCQ